MTPLCHHFCMNRTDRLYAVREELRRAGSVGRTAEQLAERFEVSPRTVKRDISALQQAGFPIRARLGRTGGYVVDPSGTLPPVSLTPAEAVALGAAIEAHAGQPFGGYARAALAKVLNVMDRRHREETAALAQRIWTNHEAARHGTGAVRSAIEEALQQRRVLALRYRSDGTTTSRDVDPMILAHTRGSWFLVARCRLRQDVRWFRLDRIARADVTTEPAVEVPIADIGEPPPTAHPTDVVVES